MVHHRTLLEKLESTSLPRSLVRWLANYLHGRMAKTLFRDRLSKARVVRTGVPQGSVISPTLFDFYVHDAPTPPDNVRLISYADDFTPYATGTDVDSLSTTLTDYVGELAEYFLDLLLSIDKCYVTLFTPQTQQYGVTPTVDLLGKPLPLENHPKVLGVHFDTMHKFAHHCKLAAAKGDSSNGVIIPPRCDRIGDLGNVVGCHHVQANSHDVGVKLIW